MNGWDVDPNLYASPYRALVEWARQLLSEEANASDNPQPCDAVSRC